MPGPLHGYRIVDLTSNVSGPLATMILADQGAEVIKVEAPGIGDSTRSGANRRGGFTAGFLNNNRNKRSIALDLKQPGAKDVLLRLAAGADAFVQNYRPGVADRLGVGEDAIRAVKPDIVYVSISGFGEKGPYAQAPAYDPVIQGFSALATVQAGSDRERPLDKPEWLEDERFKTPSLRAQNIEARLQMTQDVLIGRPSAEWLDRLTAADVPCGPVLTRSEMIRHPHVQALELLEEYAHPKAGRLRQSRAAARFSTTPPSIRRGAPALGEDTEAVLAELGYSAADIAELRDGGAFGPARGQSRW